MHQESLKQRVLRAGGWNFAGYGLSQVLRLATNLVMTRLLVPEMFGVVAIATTVTTILALLSDIGVRQNIVQSQRGEDPAFLDTAWVLQIARGGVLWLIALALSAALYLANRGGLVPPGTAYASPVLPLVLAVTSFSSVITGFRSTKWATAYRRFEQKRIIQIELASQIAGVAVMVPIGALTGSVWALVTGGLVAALAVTVLSHVWMGGHTNGFRWDKSALRELIDFGKWIFASSFLGVLASSGDTLLLGSFVEADVLGIYVIATLIVGAVPGGLTRLFAMVALPALSETARERPERMREVYYRMRVPADLLLLALSGALVGAGQLLIDLLYDARYSGAGSFVEVLALSFVVARYNLAFQLYLAMGMPRYLTVINLVTFLSLYSVVPVCFYAGGTQAAIWGIALHGLAAMPFVFRFNARLGVLDLRREAIVLLAFPVGWLCGAALSRIVA